MAVALPGHGTPMTLGRRVLPLPFSSQRSQASRGQEGTEDFCDSGVHWPLYLRVGWGKDSKLISKLEAGSVETETFLEGFLKSQGGVFSTL